MATSARAQEPASPSPPPTPPAPTNFMDHSRANSIRWFSEFPIYSFYLGTPDVNGVAYVPNFSPRLGLQLDYQDLGLSMSSALPLPKEEIERRGQTRQLNFLISKYWRASGLDLFYQDYLGFYIASPWTELKTAKPVRYPQLPDARIKHYGINFYQVLDPTSYSLKSAFSQMEIQVNSGGSFLWSVFFDHLDLNRGDSFQPGSEVNGENQKPPIKIVRLNTLGGGFGYGYTFIRNRFQLSQQILLGIGAQNQMIDNDFEDQSATWSASFKGNFNAGLAYSWSASQSVGGRIILDTIVSHIRSTQIYSSLLNASLYWGYRF